MKKTFFTLFCLICSFNLWSQEAITWAVLQDVKFEYKRDSSSNAFIFAPTFGEKVKAVAGKEVEIAGFMIPLDVEASEYVLSGVTMNACFFCGGAGPESVLELDLGSNTRTFDTDEYLTFRGVLKLNEDDTTRLTYILEDAELKE